MTLRNKIVIVTGGNRGIGRAISLAFAQEGAKVIIAARNETKAREVMDDIKKQGSECLFVRTDVSQSEEIHNLVKATLDEFKRIDILVSNAGIISIAPVVDLQEKEWDKIMEVNAKGVFLCCRAVAKQMIKQKSGKIINVSSRLGKVGVPRYAHYCASKAAVMVFSQTLALELAPYGINVNSVAPGIIETDMQRWEWEWDRKVRGMSLEELKDEALATIPLRRMGTPEDVARVVVFLASADADYLTGQSINVTGGMEFR
ncbi:3-ketoacyl-ACP reductase [Candidatus Aerophobetes bacterium Ae_b3b]|nr:MAG: 3-ketoacyl-ACP reductase [Candidatus Aerophobetes bacterium Ae_b3b]